MLNFCFLRLPVIGTFEDGTRPRGGGAVRQTGNSAARGSGVVSIRGQNAQSIR